MKHFIGTLLGMVFAAQVAVAGVMPIIELSGTGVVVSASKPGQVASITTINASQVSSTNISATNAVQAARATITNISGTTADLTTMRLTNINATGIVTATTFSGALAWNSLSGIPQGVQDISTTPVISPTLAVLQNLNGIYVSSTSWGFVAGMNQGVSTTSSPTFAGLNLSTLRVSDTSYLGGCLTSVTCSGANDSGRLCYKAVSQTYFICDGAGSWAPVQVGTKVSATAF